jgi:hypothetical protein
MLSSQVIIDNPVCDGEKLALFAGTAFYARFSTDTWAPFILAGGRIACSAFGRFPTHWIDIASSTEKPTKQGYLLF